jgi:GRIM-19 protein
MAGIHGCGRALQSIKDLIYKQEKAPPGGFPSIRYARRLPSTGPTGATLFAVGAVISAYGFYKVGVTNGKRRCAQTPDTSWPHLEARSQPCG